jgi:predicted dienelactone hydrolase
MVKRNTTVFDHYIPIPVVVGDKKHRSERVRWRGENNMFARKSKSVVAVLVIVVLALGLLPSAQAQEGPKPEAAGLRPDAPPYALHGPYWAGVTQLEAETPTHPTKVMVWYPALNPEGAEEIATYYFDYIPDLGDMPIIYHSLQDAAPDLSGGPYPLVIYVHGLNGERHGGNWLGAHLATYGFVVMSIDQQDNQGTLNDTTVFPSAWITRPREVSWQIDYADGLTTADGKLANMIDTDHVAVVGHSLGGYTTLLAGGARLDWKYYDTWCAENGANTVAPGLGGINLCESLNLRDALAPLVGVDANQEGLWPSLADSRVDAIVPMAPAYWPMFGPDGMSEVTVPMLFMGGSGDVHLVPPDWEPFYANAGSAQKALAIFENGNHQIFWFGCDAAPWWVPDSFYWCSDAVWDMDRVHDLANHFTTAFLLATLKGDTDAAAALAPDAVSFPGITYEATGF